jgi:hypothetical protein
LRDVPSANRHNGKRGKISTNSPLMIRLVTHHNRLGDEPDQDRAGVSFDVLLEPRVPLTLVRSEVRAEDRAGSGSCTSRPALASRKCGLRSRRDRRRSSRLHDGGQRELNLAPNGPILIRPQDGPQLPLEPARPRRAAVWVYSKAFAEMISIRTTGVPLCDQVCRFTAAFAVASAQPGRNFARAERPRLIASVAVVTVTPRRTNRDRRTSRAPTSRRRMVASPQRSSAAA